MSRPVAPPVALNAGIILAQILSLAGCCYAASQAQGWLQIMGLALVFGVLMNSVYSIIHEAEHGMLFTNRFWNDWIGSVLALFFPAPFHLIRQGHLGHHLRNRSDDEAFDLYFEEDHRWLRILILYGIITGFYWAVVALSNVLLLMVPYSTQAKYWKFDRPSHAFMQALNPGYSRLIQCECAAAILLHVGIVWLLQIPIGTYLAMYAAFGFMWSAMQYVHHFDTERSVTKGARNLWLWRPIDRIWLNHNWHLAHHENPTVPWIYLPQIGRQEPVKRGFLVTAYIRMWRGPRYSTERVENKYAGRVIR